MDGATPGKSRRQPRNSMRSSISSEYDSAMDDSDSSLYYSMVEDSESPDKENSKDWTVTDNKKYELRSAKKATPLLRKVLQSNATPRNKHNKRVSFSDSPKPMPSGEKCGKVHPKTPRRTRLNAGDVEAAPVDSEVVSCQEKFAALMTISESTGAETWTETMAETPTGIKVAELTTIAESESIDTVANVCTDNEMPSNQLLECFGVISDGASDGGSDDRDISFLENTIIEQIGRTSDSSLQGIPITDKALTPIVESQEPHGENEGGISPVVQSTPPANVREHIKSVISSVVASLTPGNAKSATAILEESKRRGTHVPTNNPTRLARTQLAKETRKSIVPKPASSRQTSFRRRSSTYEPKKVDARKSISVLKKVRKSLKRPEAEEKNDDKPLGSDKGNPSTSNQATGMAEAFNVQPSIPNGVATAIARKPRYTIMGTSRPSLTVAQRKQRREATAPSNGKKPETDDSKDTVSSIVRPSMARPSVARSSMARPSMIPPSMARPSMARPSMARPSMARPSVPSTRPSMAAPSSNATAPARPSTAQASMAAPSTTGIVKIPRRTTTHPKPTPSTISAPTATLTAKPSTVTKPPHLSTNSKPSRKTIAPPKPQSNVSDAASQCTYCDKKFVKGLALRLHLLNNCEKIPSTQRRLLLQSEQPSNNTNVTNEAAAAAAGAPKSDTGHGELVATIKRMPKVFAGVTRTPSKSIKCHICRCAFLNCAEYATHVVEHQYDRKRMEI